MDEHDLKLAKLAELEQVRKRLANGTITEADIVLVDALHKEALKYNPTAKHPLEPLVEAWMRAHGHIS